MGIKDLKALIYKHAPGGMVEKPLTSYSGKVIAIDTSIYMYRFMAFGNYLNGFVRQILILLEYNIVPLYIFDGKPPEEKMEVIQSRRDLRDKYLEEKSVIEQQIETTTDEVVLKELKFKLFNINKKVIVVTHEHITRVKELLHRFGVPYLVANGEAEILCAKLAKEGHVYGCMSEDTDLLPNGCDIFINNFKTVSGIITEYNLPKILEEMKITHGQFVDICILCGCDYTCKIEGVAKEGALMLIRKYGNIEGVIDFIEKQNKKKCKYVVPVDFNYQRAREIFNTPLDELVEKHYIKPYMQQMDPKSLNIFIYDNCQELASKFQHMLKKVKSNLNTSSTPLTVSKKSKTIDMYFTTTTDDQS